MQPFCCLEGNNCLPSRRKSNTTRKSLYLWEFLFGLLEDDECTSVICWIDKREGIFVLKNTDELAKLWGTVKNRPKMDKNKLIRAIRTYYNRGMLKKVITSYFHFETMGIFIISISGYIRRSRRFQTGKFFI
jgi:hypothetical protein